MRDKLVIKKRDLLLIILFLPFLTYNLTAKFGDSWNTVQMIDSVLIIFLFFKRVKFQRITSRILLFGVLVVVFTYMGEPSEIESALFYTIRLFAFFLIMDEIILQESLTALNFIVLYEGIIICINIFFQIVSPDMFGHNDISGNYFNFFASDNELPYIYVSYIALIAVFSWRKHEKIKPYVYAMLAVCTLSMIVCWAGTGIVGMVIIWIAIILQIDKFKSVTFKRILIGFMIIYVGVVVFRIHEAFEYFIVNVLNKDLTLSSRTILWDYALEYIRENLWIGMGTMDGGRVLFIPTATGQLYSSHSFFLEITVQVGIIGLIIYISMYINAGRRLMASKGNRIYGIVLSALLAMLVMYMTEGWIYQPLQYMLLFAMCGIEPELKLPKIRDMF